jgi:hypothetical protein
MKNNILNILLIIVFIGGLFLFLKNRPIEQKILNTNQIKEQINTESKWETKTDDQANVTTMVTPLDFSSKLKEWKFNILMDTHSVELDQDMIKIAVLVDDNGKEYKPIAWEGTEAGGHHREGVLKFNQITPIPKSVILKISEIGGIMRSFKWDIK